jgi:hypothetical protein
MRKGRGQRPVNPHWGRTLDAFLTGNGIHEAVTTEAATRVMAWRLTQEPGLRAGRET